MRIALVGYGKMGHIIEKSARNFGHEVAATVDVAAEDATCIVPQGDYAAVADAVRRSGADGVIEFSHPRAAAGNIKALLPLGLPLVVGTTGWGAEEDGIRRLAEECGGVVMRSANFSVGVNMFYRIVEEAAKLAAQFDEYDAAIFEAHHNQKADSPSGTALDIARRLMANYPSKTRIVTEAFHAKPQPNELHVASMRLGAVPGTHTVFFDSGADTIELTHRARGREGFANGAVHALERLAAGIADGRLMRGRLYGMDDLF